MFVCVFIGLYSFKMFTLGLYWFIFFLNVYCVCLCRYLFSFKMFPVCLVWQVLDGSNRGLSTASMPADRAQAKPRSGKCTQTDSSVSETTPARKPGKVLSRMASRKNRVRDQASHSRKQQTARPHSVHWCPSHKRAVRVGLDCQARCDYHPWSQPSPWQWRWKQRLSRGDNRITRAIILTDSMSLLQKVKSGMGSPEWNVSLVDIRLRRLQWLCCLGHAGVLGNDRAHGLAGKASGLLLGTCWGAWDTHYLRVQSQGHHTIDRLEERSVESGSAGRSSVKGRERAIINQTNIGTLGKLLRDGMENIWAFPSA